MPYDSAATRARLLDAAYHEFSERGLAGARVDRIAAAASANKQAIYAYFGSKDNLFDAVLSDRLSVLADTAPYTPDDLPGYAGALFDALNANPDLLRLTPLAWLERDDATRGEIDSHLEKAVALRTALGAGRPDGHRRAGGRGGDQHGGGPVFPKACGPSGARIPSSARPPTERW
ncbi:TetR/AcrR family transcriptional regulator [Streptomyces sp. T1317-0309]|nr:TetR/AcrR family transcriptional regulator [Streptomyces sp. T1317-0309]